MALGVAAINVGAIVLPLICYLTRSISCCVQRDVAAISGVHINWVRGESWFSSGVQNCNITGVRTKWISDDNPIGSIIPNLETVDSVCRFYGSGSSNIDVGFLPLVSQR